MQEDTVKMEDFNGASTLLDYNSSMEAVGETDRHAAVMSLHLLTEDEGQKLVEAQGKMPLKYINNCPYH